MDFKELKKVENYSYEEYCNYLKGKYGMVPFSYGSIKNREGDNVKGLFIHHIGENEIPSLSNYEIRKIVDQKYQKAEMLVYADYLEHALLHLKIVKETEYHEQLGINGLSNYLIPGLKNFFIEGTTHPKWNALYYERIKNDKDVFEYLLNEYNKIIKTLDLTFEFNDTLYLQVEESLNSKNKALAVLGTGLGKTTIALKYMITHNLKGLLIGPNNLIKEGWGKYSEFVDTITYSGFANRYSKIDYSQYQIVILDEAHHVGYDEELGKGAVVWGNAIKYLFDLGIKVLGLTATPDRTDGIMLGETFFKDCICEGLTIEDAIEKGIVHPFSYVTALYDTNGITNELKELGLKFNEDKHFNMLVGQLDLELNNRPSVSEIFNKYMPKNRRKGIIFIQEIEDSENAMNVFKQAFPNTEFRVLHSKLEENEIENNRKWFEKTEEGFLIAINMISEGAHYKGVNTIIMFRRTESYVLYTQQIGRIITLARNENPNAIVFDLVNNINSIKYNDRVKSKEKRKMPSDIRKALMKTQALKSGQIIIADETQNISEKFRELKSYVQDDWEDWEFNILIENYQKFGWKKVSQLINLKKNSILSKNTYTEKNPYRTKSAILHKASNLGIFHHDEIYNNYFTEEEIKMIMEYYEKENGKQILCQALSNRSFESIKRFASRKELKLWNIWQNDFVLHLLQDLNLTDQEIGEKINKTSSDVHQARIRKGIIKIEKGSRKKWSFEEIEKLKSIYPEKGRDSYLFFEGRTQEQVCGKAKELKLKSNVRYSKIRKKILCVETGEIFSSIKEAKDKKNIGSGIINALKDPKKTAGGYHWKYID